MAEDIVQAYIEQDKKNYEASALHFAAVFRQLFPELPDDKIDLAARAYADALGNHDTIEEGGHTKTDQLNHQGWNQVREDLDGMCRALGIPAAYATATTEFFRHHGVGDSNFISHMLDSDRIFTTSIIGNDKFAMILGGLYLACIRCHDIHTEYGVELGKKLMEIYYSIILENTWPEQ